MTSVAIVFAAAHPEVNCGIYTVRRGPVRGVTEGSAMGYTIQIDHSRAFPRNEWLKANPETDARWRSMPLRSLTTISGP